MDVQQIATIIVRPARSYSILTAPGHRFHVQNGRGTILSDSDLDYVLGLDDVVLEPEARYREHIADRIVLRDRFHPARATIHIGGGVLMSAEQYRTSVQSEPAPEPDPEPEPEPSEPSGWPVDQLVTISPTLSRRGRTRG